MCLVDIVTCKVCLVGKDIRDYDAAKLLLHYCVLAANERGQPKGQVLQDDEAGPSTSGAPAERQNQTEDNTVEVLCLIYCMSVCGEKQKKIEQILFILE